LNPFPSLKDNCNIIVTNVTVVYYSQSDEYKSILFQIKAQSMQKNKIKVGIGKAKREEKRSRYSKSWRRKEKLLSAFDDFILIKKKPLFILMLYSIFSHCIYYFMIGRKEGTHIQKDIKIIKKLRSGIKIEENDYIKNIKRQNQWIYFDLKAFPISNDILYGWIIHLDVNVNFPFSSFLIMFIRIFWFFCVFYWGYIHS